MGFHLGFRDGTCSLLLGLALEFRFRVKGSRFRVLDLGWRMKQKPPGTSHEAGIEVFTPWQQQFVLFNSGIYCHTRNMRQQHWQGFRLLHYSCVPEPLTLNPKTLRL